MHFIGDDVQAKVTLVIVGLLEAFRRHVVQAQQPAAGRLAVGDIEGVELVQALEVVLEQGIGAAAFGWRFGQRLGAAGTENQYHPVVHRHIAVEQTHQRGPEVGPVQVLDQPANGVVPGHVLQCQVHVATHSGVPHRCNYLPPGGAAYFAQPWRVQLAEAAPH
ncbi:hypothetical protein D3C81_1729610 [compost metagenome]